jgi:hypothetical protein
MVGKRWIVTGFIFSHSPRVSPSLIYGIHSRDVEKLIRVNTEARVRWIGGELQKTPDTDAETVDWIRHSTIANN